MASKKRTGKPGWDAAPKVRADSKLKLRPAEDQETLWLLMNPTDDTVPPYTLEAALVYLQEDCNLSVAASTLSEWHSWYALKRRMDAAAERAEQVRLELAKDPNVTPEDLERVAQTVFTAEAIQAGNLKGYVSLAKLNLAGKKLGLDARRIAVLEKKAAQADAATGVVNNGALTDAEKAAQLKRIFRMG